MSMFCARILQEPYLYGDNKSLSQPFRFIGLPLYCVLLFILYWFIYCPLMFVKVYHYAVHPNSGWPAVWPYYFWIVALAVFLILVSILVLLWKMSPKSDNRLYEVHYVENDKESLKSELNKKDLSDSENSFEKCEIAQEVIEENEMKPKNEIKTRKLTLQLKEEVEMETEINSEKVTTPLSPREIFFHDLIESANKSLNSSTTINDNRKSGNEEEQEFFIASVSPSKTCVSNVFMFVNPDTSQEENLEISQKISL